MTTFYSFIVLSANDGAYGVSIFPAHTGIGPFCTSITAQPLPDTLIREVS